MQKLFRSCNWNRYKDVNFHGGYTIGSLGAIYTSNFGLKIKCHPQLFSEDCVSCRDNSLCTVVEILALKVLCIPKKQTRKRCFKSSIVLYSQTFIENKTGLHPDEKHEYRLCHKRDKLFVKHNPQDSWWHG
ncbi:hypothetical protein Ahy_A09g042214 isoform C [Arachis hypogaea]|uniref:Uncharacterized protein n=1 Tax=Arachis hypogaea TaxID=3818 RepID=A0A445BF72_ARAHY|nr:hypothetical protein Ahy_A09g042214 isoform C [Arachis hypogaea]